MRISYDIRLDDLYALQRHCYDHAASIRRAVLWRQVVGIVLGLCMPIAAWAFFPPEAWPLYFLGLLVILFFLFLAPRIWRSNYMRAVRRQYAGTASNGLVGSHLLEIAGEDLVSTNADRQVRTRISSLVRIEEDDDRVYVFTTAVNAHVIPHETVAEGDAEGFVAILKQRMAVASGESPGRDAIQRPAGAGSHVESSGPMMHPCLGCGFCVLDAPAGSSYVICPVCGWEDDVREGDDPYFQGGANGASLADHQQSVLEKLPLGVLDHLRYRRDPKWRPSSSNL
jgi:hypothetical protein